MKLDFDDPKFDFAKHVCKKYRFDEDAVCRALDLYSRCYIDEEQCLEVLQWLPEEARVTIWNAYKNSNKKC